MLAQREYERAYKTIGKAMAATEPKPRLAVIYAVQACFTPYHMLRCLQPRWHAAITHAWQADPHRELVHIRIYDFVTKYAVAYRSDICVYYGKIIAGVV